MESGFLFPEIANWRDTSPDFEGGLYKFAPSKHFDVRKAVALNDVVDANGAEGKKIGLKLRLDWGHASAHQLKQISVDAEGENERLLETH